MSVIQVESNSNFHIVIARKTLPNILREEIKAIGTRKIIRGNNIIWVWYYKCYNFVKLEAIDTSKSTSTRNTYPFASV